MRWKLPWTERKRRIVLREAFETTKKWAIKNENGRFEGLSTLYNIALYLLIAHRDIQSAKIDALTHPDEWTRKLHARIILLTIYEWDADKVAGQKLRKALDQMHVSDDLKIEATNALRALRAVQNKADSKFSFIRNAAIAHRDPNALVQYRAIRDLNPKDVTDIAIEFFAAADQLTGVLTKLMLDGNSLQSFLTQWSATTQKIDTDKRK